METAGLKSIAIVTTLFAALVGGYLPLWYKRQQRGQALLTQGYHFAKGIFLGAALMHLLPAAEIQFEKAYPNWDYPLMGLVVLVTIFLLHAIEHYSINVLGRFAKLSTNITIYLLIFTLSIHSIIEGAALGVGGGLAEIMIILIAVLAHKSADAFALVINMQRRGFKTSIVHPVMVIFACMTPFGVLLGSLINHLAAANDNNIMLALIDAITAGTFIYIACLEQDDMPELNEASNDSSWNIVSLGVGIVVMAVVAFWI